MQNVVIQPVITEQSMQLATTGKFTFLVALTSNKQIIKNAIEEQFKVNVVDIATTIVKHKTKRVGKRRTEKQLGSYKKALVHLKKGQKIDLFDLEKKK